MLLDNNVVNIGHYFIFAVGCRWGELMIEARLVLAGDGSGWCQVAIVSVGTVLATYWWAMHIPRHTIVVIVISIKLILLISIIIVIIIVVVP